MSPRSFSLNPVRIWKTLRSVLRFERFEWNREKRTLRRAANMDDLRQVSRKRLPSGVFDYIDGAAEDESALRRNALGYSKITFKPRVLRNVADIDVSSSLLGKPLSAPVVLAPTGFTRIANSQGELAVARAAAATGLPYTLSTLGTRSIEEVAAVSSGRLWFQVYVWRDRDLVADLLTRAAAASYEAIVITVDTAVLGRRERDIRRGFTLPPKIGLATLFDGIIHPGWTLDFLRSEPISFANVAGQLGLDGSSAVSLAEYISTQFDPALSWDDLVWFRDRWNGPIILKGIQTVEDARLAVSHGVEAIALSNHGGRQLDHAPAPIDLVPGVRKAVGGDIEIICDGGVRRGSDIVKALALGADAVMIGRPYLYGLGAAGELGVAHALRLLTEGMAKTMALIGCSTLKELDESYLEREEQ